MTATCSGEISSCPSGSDPAETRRMVQRLREAVALDPGFVLAWDGLAQSLTGLAGARSPPRPPSCGRRRQRHEPAWRRWHRTAGSCSGSAPMRCSPRESGPKPSPSPRRSWSRAPGPGSTPIHTLNLIFAVGRLEETARIVGELKAIEPLAMFVSRDQQWNLTALRRYDDAEAEYQRGKTLAGSIRRAGIHPVPALAVARGHRSAGAA